MIINFHYNGNNVQTIEYLYKNNSKKIEFFYHIPHFFKYKEDYFLNDKLHRFNKPARKCFNEDGICIYELYYLNGKLHNSLGPAEIAYYPNFKALFFLNNIFIPKNEFIQIMENKLNDY